jgi:hypothetical protein
VLYRRGVILSYVRPLISTIAGQVSVRLARPLFRSFLPAPPPLRQPRRQPRPQPRRESLSLPFPRIGIIERLAARGEARRGEATVWNTRGVDAPLLASAVAAKTPLPPPLAFLKFAFTVRGAVPSTSKMGRYVVARVPLYLWPSLLCHLTVPPIT